MISKDNFNSSIWYYEKGKSGYVIIYGSICVISCVS